MGRDEISRRCQREGIPGSRGRGRFIVRGGQSELLNTFSSSSSFIGFCEMTYKAVVWYFLKRTCLYNLTNFCAIQFALNKFDWNLKKGAYPLLKIQVWNVALWGLKRW